MTEQPTGYWSHPTPVGAGTISINRVLLPTDFGSPNFDSDGATPLAPPPTNRGGTGASPARHWSADTNTVWVPAFYNIIEQPKNGFVPIDVTDIEAPVVGAGVEFNISGIQYLGVVTCASRHLSTAAFLSANKPRITALGQVLP